MSFYKPTQDEIEKYSEELGNLIENRTIINNNLKKTSSYDDLIIEENSTKGNKSYKNNGLMSHFESFKRLKQNGFTDHLPFNFQMKMIADYISGKIPKTNLIAKSLSLAGFEWSSNLIEVKDAYIHIYSNNNNLLWCDTVGVYTPPTNNIFIRPNGEEILNFESYRLPSNVIMPLKEVNEKNKDLIKILFSYTFEDLPLELQEKTFLKLPSINTIYPLTVRRNSNLYIISTSEINMFSRGCKLIDKND